MFDRDLIDGLPAVSRAEVKNALKQLVWSGILEKQKELLLERLVAGDRAEPLPLVAQRVLDYRSDAQALEALEDLAKEFITEEDDA